MMAPFFTDASMKTMKPEADMKKAWAGMAKADQDKMMKECNDAAMSKPHARRSWYRSALPPFLTFFRRGSF
ncbi:hypothetical protein [Mesorhizobium sp. AR07]|uniref:hypothetical protein n=1 Tax=Mesorhizobium sp. AR07 TaxID=2865838 RepID=UPI00215EA0CE|nr:hypothetical protein [Mesorhizobium sp. AR07]